MCTSQPRHVIDQLALNMGFGGIKQSIINSSHLSSIAATNTTSLINSTALIPPLITPSHSQQKLESIKDIPTPTENSRDIVRNIKERLMTKIDPAEMTAKSTIVTVPQDAVKRSAMLLAGHKFRLNSKELSRDKLIINSDTIYSLSVSTRGTDSFN
jgi:hypothetical protein